MYFPFCDKGNVDWKMPKGQAVPGLHRPRDTAARI